MKRDGKMESGLVQLVDSLKLEKEGCEPILLELGTVLKVVYRTSDTYLVSTDDGFTFTLAASQEDKVWKKV